MAVGGDSSMTGGVPAQPAAAQDRDDPRIATSSEMGSLPDTQEGRYEGRPGVSAAPAVLWECQVDVADSEDDLTISRVTIEASDAREAIRRCCAGLDTYVIERVEVRRV